MGLIPGSRAPLTLDLVAIAVALVIPILALSIHLARSQRRYQGHQRLQVALTLALTIALAAFETEVRTTPWRQTAQGSPYLATWLVPFLYAHLAIASATLVLWSVTLVTALRSFARPARPGAFSARHRALGWTAAAMMTMTAATGLVFYWGAFWAS